MEHPKTINDMRDDQIATDCQLASQIGHKIGHSDILLFYSVATMYTTSGGATMTSHSVSMVPSFVAEKAER